MTQRIGWLVPRPIRGSGGIREIYNKIQHLCAQGYECHAYVEGDLDEFDLADQVESLYGSGDWIAHSGWPADFQGLDLLIATAWWSAEIVAAAPPSIRKAYLVQDYEAWFNPMGDGFRWAQQSYELGLHAVCLGRWLPNVLHRDHGSSVAYFDFCCEHPLYYPTTPLDQRELAVCFIHQPEKPRRCHEIGLAALELLQRAMPEVTLYLFGGTPRANLAFPHTNLGILPTREINQLYNRCTLGLCLSSSNPSRIPFEMMAAGLPVVDLHRENNLFDFPDQGVLLVEPTAPAIAQALQHLLDNRPQLRAMSAFGADFMLQRPMDREYAQFLDAVRAVLEGAPPPQPPPLPDRLYKAGPFQRRLNRPANRASHPDLAPQPLP